MPHARLEVTDAFGSRTVTIDKPRFAIGRRENNDLCLAGSEVSRDHAEIAFENGRFLFRDRGSRYGSFVNGDQVTTERGLSHGDKIRLGRGGGAELVFLAGDVAAAAESSATQTAVSDLRHVAALLEGLRALGSGRVLDDVLALVLDSALDVSNAERGFIMLAGEGGALEFKLGRSRGRMTLPGRSFATSRKIPEEVFESGRPRIEADLLDGDLANVHMGTVALGIRNVLCVPLRLVRYLEQAAESNEEERIGVLYLDSREKGVLSTSTRMALETLATEAAVAIENARLYRETLEKARLEQEMRIAAEIQRALMPRTTQAGRHFEAAAASIPCRSIGGDFFDYVQRQDGALGFALGDVAGKGPPAALLSALVQGVLAAQGTSNDGPALSVSRINDALIRRAIDARFVTVFYALLAPDGTLTYCNAGHNPPLVVGPGGVRRLDIGGPIVGLFEGVPFQEGSLRLEPGEWVVVFSDGVSEALSSSGEEFGDDRILRTVTAAAHRPPSELLDQLLGAVRDFTKGAPQSDDVTALVVRYRSA